MGQRATGLAKHTERFYRLADSDLLRIDKFGDVQSEALDQVDTDIGAVIVDFNGEGATAPTATYAEARIGLWASAGPKQPVVKPVCLREMLSDPRYPVRTPAVGAVEGLADEQIERLVVWENGSKLVGVQREVEFIQVGGERVVNECEFVAHLDPASELPEILRLIVLRIQQVQEIKEGRLVGSDRRRREEEDISRSVRQLSHPPERLRRKWPGTSEVVGFVNHKNAHRPFGPRLRLLVGTDSNRGLREVVGMELAD